MFPTAKRLFGRGTFPLNVAATAAGVIVAILAALGIGLGIGAQTNPGLSSATGDRQQWDWDSRQDLEDEAPLQWYSHEILDGGKKIRVFFNIGTPKCYGIRSEVVETATSVSISLFKGTIPGAPEQCTLEATSASSVVELEQPLSARVLLHGN